MAQVVEVELVAKTDKAVDGVNKVEKAVEKTARSAKKASKELSGLEQGGREVVKGLDRLTGGLASKFVAVGKAAKLSGKAMRTALISSGIGLAVAAVGLLVEYWDEIGEALGFINKDLERQVELNNQNLDAVGVRLRNIKTLIELRKREGKDVDLLLKKEKQLTEQKKQALITSIQDQSLLVNRLKLKQKEGKLNEEDTKELIKQEGIYLDLINNLNKFKSDLLEPVKEVVKKDVKDDPEVAIKKKALEEIKKLEDEYALSLIDKQNQEKIAVAAKYDDLIAQAELYNEDTFVLIAARNAETKAIEEKFKAEKDAKDAEDKLKEEEKQKKRLEDIQKIVNDATELSEIEKIERDRLAAQTELDLLGATWIEKARIAAYYQGLINDEVKKDKDEQAEYDKKLDQSVLDAKLSMAANASSLLSDIVGKDSKAGKAFALASATISGIQGVQNAYTTAQESPITLGFPAYPVLQATLAGLVAAKNIQAIKSINPSGGGGGSVPRPSGGGSQAPAFNVVGASGETQLADAIGGQSQRPARAYVVSNDVTTAQELDRNIIEGASI
jgi:hypothetical protein